MFPPLKFICFFFKNNIRNYSKREEQKHRTFETSPRIVTKKSLRIQAIRKLGLPLLIFKNWKIDGRFEISVLLSRSLFPLDEISTTIRWTFVKGFRDSCGNYGAKGRRNEGNGEEKGRGTFAPSMHVRGEGWQGTISERKEDGERERE